VTPWLRSGHAPHETSAPTRGEERRARVHSGATEGVTIAIRTLFPLSAHSVPREVLCISSTLDEIDFSTLLQRSDSIPANRTT
jgi:hypothetical protein